MYTEFYGLTKHPFASTADPDFLYLSDSHKQALHHLRDTVKAYTGVTVLTGDIGTGKTMLLKTFMRSLEASTRVAFVPRVEHTLPDTLLAVLHALRIRAHDKSPDALQYALREYLSMCSSLKEAVLLILDEAQDVARDVFEVLHALVYPEDGKTQGLHLILSGHQALGDQHKMSAVWHTVQHDYGSFHLQPLSYQDTEGYIERRLQIAQAGYALFTVAAVEQIYWSSAGIPRVINTLCDAALMVGFGTRQRNIGPDIVMGVAESLHLDTRGSRSHPLSCAPPARRSAGSFASQAMWPQANDRRPVARVVAAGLVVAGLLGGVWWHRSGYTPPAQSPSLAGRVPRSPVAQPVTEGGRDFFLLPMRAPDTRAISSEPPEAPAPARQEVAEKPPTPARRDRSIAERPNAAALPSRKPASVSAPDSAGSTARPVAASRQTPEQPRPGKARGQGGQRATTEVPADAVVSAQPQEKTRPQDTVPAPEPSAHAPDARGARGTITEVTASGVSVSFAAPALDAIHPRSHAGHQEAVAAVPRELQRPAPIPQQSAPLARERQAPRHTVYLQSMPEGATVLIDGKPAGKTPLALQLGRGVHTVTLEKDGYGDIKDRIHLTGDGPSSFFHNLSYSSDGG